MSGMMMAAAAAQKRAPSIDPDAATFIARFTTPPSSPRIAAINTLFLSLKSSGVYAKLDCLYIAKKAQDEQSSLLDWKRSTKSAGYGGDAAFDSDMGFSGITGDGYVTSSYTPNIDSVNFQPNSGGVGYYQTSKPEGSQFLYGCVDSNSNTTVCARVTVLSSTTFTLYGVESCGTNLASTSPAVNESSFLQTNRTSSSSIEIFVNAVSWGSNTGDNSSRALSSKEFYLLGFNNNGSAMLSKGATAAVWVGAPLNTTEQSDLKTALDTYFAAL